MASSEEQVEEEEQMNDEILNFDDTFDDDEYCALLMADFNSNNSNNSNDSNNRTNVNNNNRPEGDFNFQRLVEPHQEKTQPPGFVASRVQSEDFVRSLDSIAVSHDFVHRFDIEFGTTHPTFCLGPFHKALQHAKEKNQLVLVYLHTNSDPSTAFCMTLLSEQLADFIDMNFVFWAGHLENMNTYLGKIAGSMEQPLMAVVGADNNGNTNVIEFLHGIADVDELMSRLIAVQEYYGDIRNSMNSHQRAIDQMLNQDRRLKKEQEEAYLNSLVVDRRKQEQEEEEMILLKSSQEAKRIALEQKRANFPPEPTDSKDSTQIVIRFPDGTRIQRRFTRNEKIQMLYDFVELNNQDIAENEKEFTLVTSFPKKVLVDKEASLASENLVPQALIHIQF